MNAYIISLIGYYSALFGINPAVSLAVVQEESRFNPKAIGKAGEIGLFQLMPSSFPNVKKKSLANPKINIRLGIKYLAWVKKHCNHKEDDTYLVCYNFGIENAKKVKHPKLFPYYKKIKKAMKQYDAT